MASASDKHTSQSESDGPRDGEAESSLFTELNGTFLSISTTSTSDKDKKSETHCSRRKQHKEHIEIFESMLSQLEVDKRYANDYLPGTVTAASDIPARETTSLSTKSN